MKVLGRLLGLALWHGIPLGIELAPVYIQILFGNEDWRATRQEDDAAFYAAYVKPLEELSVRDLGLDSFTTFVKLAGPAAPDPSGARWSLVEDGGELRVRLREHGEAVPLTDENKAAYIEDLWDWRYHGAAQLTGGLREGLEVLVPPSVIEEVRAIMQPAEFSAGVAGEARIDFEDWERNTLYTHGYARDSEPIEHFWRVLAKWAAEEPHLLREVLHFATGARRVPAGGFAHLQGHQGTHKFSLAKATHLAADALPTVHACICTIDWPEYPNYATAEAKLRIAIELGSKGFDEGGAHHE